MGPKFDDSGHKGARGWKQRNQGYIWSEFTREYAKDFYHSSYSGIKTEDDENPILRKNRIKYWKISHKY